MSFDSVRSVKNEARRVVSQMLRNDVSRGELGIRAQSIDNAVQPPTNSGDYKLAVRVQHRLLLGSKEGEFIRQMAKGEEDVRYIGQLQKAATGLVSQEAPARVSPSIKFLV